MLKKLHISLIFSNLVVKTKTTKITAMHNLYANFVKILEACKHFAQESCGTTPKTTSDSSQE